MKRVTLLSLVLLTSCFNPISDGEVEVNLAKFAKGKKPSIANISLSNDQIVITGSNLGAVNNVEVDSNALTIVSKNENTLILSAAAQVNLVLNTALNLMVSSAYGAASVSVTFNLVDGSVTANKIGDGEIGANHFSSMGAAVGQILKFDGTNWVVSDLGTLTYAGNWNADTNTPDLSGGGQPGEYYIVTTSGTTDLSGGVGTDDWGINDWVIWNSVLARWEKVSNSSTVTSFNGRQGAISPQTGDYTWAQIDKTSSSLTDIANVDTTGLSAGKILKYDGSNWIVADDDAVSMGTVDSSSIVDGSVADIDLAGGISQAKITGLPALSTQVTTNTASVATNTTNISTNASDIATINTTLTGKEATITAGLVSQYFRGDKSWQTLDSDAVTEGSNLYFTNARARTAAVVNTTAGGETDQAASVSAMKSYVTSQISAAPGDNLGNHTLSQNMNVGNHYISSDGDAEGISIGSAGKVSITSATDTPLEVINSTGENILIKNSTQDINTNPYRSYIGAKDSADTSVWYIGDYSSTESGIKFMSQQNLPLSFGTNNTDRLTIRNSTGDVGIGTSFPTEKLSVDGNINVTAGNDICIAGGACLSTAGAGGGDFMADGSVAMTGDFDLGVNKIVNGGGSFGIQVANDGHVGIGANPNGNDLIIYRNGVGSPTLQLANSSSGASNSDGAQISLNGSVFGFDHKEAGGIFRFNHNGNVAALEIKNDKVAINAYANNANFEISKNGQAGSIPFIISSDDDNNGDILIVNSAGNLGLGTVSPSTKLDVNGAISVSAGNDICISGGACLSTAGDVESVTAGTGLTGGGLSGAVTLNADIGTGVGQLMGSDAVPNCSASQKLQMSAGPVYSWSCVTDSNTNAAVLCTAGQFLNGDGSCDPIPSGQDPSYGSSASSPANAAYISDFGYLGLGTTSPDHKLHVNNGNALITGLNMGLQIKETDTVDQNWQMTVNGGALRYATLNDSLGGASEKMVLLNNGNLGVGVTDPDARVEVSGQIKITGGTPGNGKVLTSDANGLASWQTLTPPGDNLGNHTATQNIDIGSNTIVSGGGTYGLRVDNDGHVGVGIAPGYHPLRIYKNDPGSPTIQILSSTSGTGTNDGAQISLNGSTFGFDHKEAGGSIRFNTVESPTIMELRDNKVGINTYALDANFEISKNGVASSKPFMLSTDDNTNGDIFIVDQNGRVGIGTNTPVVELDLNTGVINASQICDENNANCIDLSAGAGGGASAIDELSDAVSDGSSVFIGTGAGANDDASSNRNTSVGVNSLASNTTGSNNTSIGHDSLNANITGVGNVAIGTNTLGANTSGRYNIALGNASLGSNTAGENNISIGTQALTVNQGDDNLAIGPGALMFNNGGNSGVAIGSEAQKNIDFTPASWTNTNTAVGHRSMLGEAAGMNNTGVGNTALGYQSLMNKTSGNNNVAIGDRAGDLITTGSNNILIGANVDTPANSTDNYINIGNTLYGNSSSGNVGIGTNSPASKLDVSNTFTTTVGGEYFTQNLTTIVNAGANTNGIFYGVGSKVETINDTFTHGGAITGGVFTAEHKGSGALSEMFGVGGTSILSGSGNIMQNIAGFFRSDNYSTGDIVTQSGSSSRADHGGSGTVTQLIGAAGYADVSSSSGVATTAIGVESAIVVSDTGTITNAYGLKSSLVNFTGTVSNWRGLFIESPAANPNYYSIYASGTSKSYFGGNIGVGTTTPNDAMDVVGDIDTTGCIQLNDTTTLAGVCVSDERLKNDIVPLENSLEKILELRPVRYSWDDNYHEIHKKEGEEIGLIAQEVEEVFPDMVVEKEDGFKRVKYDISMRLYIVSAIKEFFELFKSDKSEQDRRIASLEEENALLKERLERIEAALDKK